MGNDEITEVVKKPDDQPAHLPVWATILLAMLSGIGSSIPAYLKYRETKTEANAKAVEVKSDADIGYQTLVKAVEKHEQHDSQQDVWISRIEGHISAIEAALNGVTVYRDHQPSTRHSRPPVRSLSDEGDGDGGSAEQPAPPPPPPQQRSKPTATKLKFSSPVPSPMEAKQHQYIPQNLPDTLDKAVQKAKK